MNAAALIQSGVAAIGVGLLVKQLRRGKAKPKETTPHRGIVSSLDLERRQMVVKLDSPPRIKAFQWDTSTRFYDIDGTIALQALRPGCRVCIYTPIKSQAAAVSVEVEPVYTDKGGE